MRVMVARDDLLIPPAFRLERLRPYGVGEAPPLRPIQAPTLTEEDEEEEEEAEVGAPAAAPAGPANDTEATGPSGR